MSIQVTEKRRVNYLGAATAGAMAGYSAKWLIPVQNWEKDERYMSSLSEMRKSQNATLKKGMALREMVVGKSNQAAQDFFEMTDSENILKQVRGIKDPNAKAEIIDVISQLNTVSKGVREEGVKALKTVTKSLRSSGTFAFIGTGIALSFAFAKNIFCSNSKVD